MQSNFSLNKIQFLALVALLFATTFALGQGGAGELTGLVSDQTGAVVLGVKVKLSNTATGEARTTTTTPAGIYRFPALRTVMPTMRSHGSTLQSIRNTEF